MIHDSKRAIIFAVLCVFSWSLIPVISKVGTADISPLQLLFLSNVLSTTVLACIVFCLRKDISNSMRQMKKNAIHTSYLGLLGCFLYYLCLYYGYSKASAVSVLVVQYLWPVLAVLLSPFILREKRKNKNVFIAMLGFAGVIIVACKGEANIENFDNISVLTVVLIGALSFAIFSLLSKKLKGHALVTTFLFFSWASLFSLIAVLLDGGVKFPSSTSSWAGLFANGIIVNGLSYFWWLRALQLGEVSRIAPFVFLTPILACIWLVLFLDEVFFISYAIGLIICIVAGVMAATSSDAQQKASVIKSIT